MSEVKIGVPKTKYSSFRLTTTGIALLDRIAMKQGLRRVSVLENIIRKEAKAEGIEPPAYR